MSHAIYQTRALILKTKNMRESNKLLVLYTERFGLIYVSTQSVRDLKSKMRFHTNTLSLVTVDVVQGRDIWKLTGIHEEYSSITLAGTAWYELLTRMASLIIRFSSGEESNTDVWHDIVRLYDHISVEEPNESIELIFVTRFLYALGYWEGSEPWLLTEYPFSPDMYTQVTESRPLIIKKINGAIQNSQL
ncbi:recombination protein O N-terminal domain-containing protein [Patescibacteria group bacterium]|nr:recombination protein O N-terminal domain-containing protein [Patescibacteria group bacterium]